MKTKTQESCMQHVYFIRLFKNKLIIHPKIHKLTTESLVQWN